MKLAKPTVETLLEGHRLGTDQGSVAFCAINLIEGLDEHGATKRILVDTGHVGRRTDLDAALKRRGLERDDIDTVVCTHAHWDHIENLDIFGRADIVLHQNERRYIRRPHKNDFACPEWIDAVFERYDHRIREVEEGVRLIPGVEIVDAPGHSAGTIAVSVAGHEGTSVITGDSIQNSTVAREGRNALVFWNDRLAARTIDKLLTLGDVIYPGHDQPFRIAPDGKVEYVHEFQLALSGVSRDQPGLTFAPDTGFHQTIMPGIEDQRLPD
jgi:glyoxylase-like metal-dependent hydrolase (beta-lactamase superfamily II)